MAAPSSFPTFSSLPTELRLKIWAFNLPSPRIVPLHYTPASSAPSNLANQRPLRGCTSTAVFPTNLLINKEARTHAKKYYQLSFSLPHVVPKIWFDMQRDVLYFPAKEGWLGSWNHFVSAVTMTVPPDLAKVKRLAVSETLFRGVHGATSSPNVRATCVKEFWEYVRKKFKSIEEVVVLVDGGRKGIENENVRVWMEGMLDCEIGKDGMGIGGPEESLVVGLERGLRYVEEQNEWVAPRWDVLRFPGEYHGLGTVGWPRELLTGKSCELHYLELSNVLTISEQITLSTE